MQPATAATEVRTPRTYRIQDEVERLYRLPDRFLARDIITRVRNARTSLQIDPSDGYEGILVWSVIPQICKRLGETSFSKHEILNMGPSMQEQDLRAMTGLCLQNAALRIFFEMDDAEVLFNDVPNGSPVAIALDRVAPPTAHSKDLITRLMREISQVRFGHPDHLSWSPNFMDYPNANRVLSMFSFPPGKKEFALDESSLSPDDLSALGDVLSELPDDHILCGPYGDPDAVQIDPIFGKSFSNIQRDLRHQIISGCRQQGLNRISETVKPILLLEEKKDAIAVYSGFDLGLDEPSTIALHLSSRHLPQLIGAVIGADIAVDPEWRRKGVGSAMVIGTLISQGGLPTWDHDQPGYTDEGAVLVESAIQSAASLVFNMQPSLELEGPLL